MPDRRLLPGRRLRPLLAVPALAAVAGLLGLGLAPVLAPLLDSWWSPPAGDGAARAPLALDPAWLGALARQLLFSLAVLAIEVPLGLAVALALPRRGLGAGLAVAVLALPLVLPQGLFELLRAELVPRAAAAAGLSSAPLLRDWLGCIVLDVWRYTPLVALLCAFALLHARLEPLATGAQAPAPGLPAARGAGLRGACALAIALRAVDSFAAWPVGGPPLGVVAFAREALAAGPSPGAVLGVALALLILLLVPLPAAVTRVPPS